MADKAGQLKIILETNPAEDEIHTWIRSVEDILTFSEVFVEEIYDVTSDFTEKDIKEVLQIGKVTVYSSKPIENGIFVSPSKMEAASYLGDDTVYMADVVSDFHAEWAKNLCDVILPYLKELYPRISW